MKFFNIMMILFVLSFKSFASVSIIGIVINEDSKDDVLNKYRAISETDSTLTLDPKNIPLNSVSTAIIFFKDDKVKSVLLELDANKFDYFYGLLNKKYKLIQKEIPFVGDKYASFIKDDVGIALSSPHLSFKMSLMYTDKKYYDELNREQRRQDKNKMEQDINQL